MGYLYRLDREDVKGPYRTEEKLLEAIRHLSCPGDITVHVYRKRQIGRNHLGTINGSAVLMRRGVDHDQFRE